jgi:hypothetical protein
LLQQEVTVLFDYYYEIHRISLDIVTLQFSNVRTTAGVPWTLTHQQQVSLITQVLSQ